MIPLPPALVRRSEVMPETPVRSVQELLPPWKVLLHNDEVHDMLYVVESLLKAVPLTVEEAVRIMLEAHETGTGLVIVCPQETAEYYQDRILTFGLHCTIEPE
jgi:ATP-dependent Clp protease adaptor protein ClpS